jgi:hypothetical protein
VDKDSLALIARIILIGLALTAAFVAWFWLGISRVRTVLRAWAAESGLRIVAFQKTNWTGRGPFNWWTNSPRQAIFHVRVLDKEGRERSAWVRCGSYFGGVLFGNQVEVRWEEKHDLSL